ncbi:hypothetical protein B0H66DRAFT_542828 [Apodospora peruviana]|uniref:FAD dependent oxidoreductase domain-containing protein n=1 Tax=Apodospora peruviana TaxID=516989 RepID=A0AAE0IRS9_9PEZI|nr:hypothetical protein B0H66DRAFT_542828 [Apodospora peruviana]
MSSQKQHVVVIGAGVIGLSCALQLQKTGLSVTIVAEHFPSPSETMDPEVYINYSSPWAGAHNRWVPPTDSDPSSACQHAMAVATFAQMKALSLSSSPKGITFMKGIEYLESPPPEYLSLTPEAATTQLSMPGFRLLSPSEFPDDRIKWGCEYATWCLNPMVYCSFLLRGFVTRGGVIHKRILRSVAEVFGLPLPLQDVGNNCHSLGDERRRVDAVVNASGIGFGDDPQMYITRGQTCVVAETCDATVTRQNADGSWTFCVPRGAESGTVVGGTKEPDNWDPMPSREVREKLLRSMEETYPDIIKNQDGKLTPVRDIVGRRPTRRGGPRVEGEIISLGDGGNGGRGFVMHAYGLGGRGYELSWGVAEAVAAGVQEHFAQKRLGEAQPIFWTSM